MGYFQEALKSLRPDKEFSTYEDDTVIVWNDENVVSPTQEEIEVEIARLKALDNSKIDAANELKESAKAKLVAGQPLTPEEASALVI